MFKTRDAQTPNPGLTQEVFIPSGGSAQIERDFGSVFDAPTNLSNFFSTANHYGQVAPRPEPVEVPKLCMLGVRF